MGGALHGQQCLFWWMEQLYKVCMLNVWLTFFAHMVTDKQLAIKISQSYKPMAEIAKRTKAARWKIWGIHLPCSDCNSDRQIQLHWTAPNSQSVESWAWCRMPRRVLTSLLTPVPSLFCILVLPVHDRGCWRLALYICLCWGYGRIHMLKDRS